MTTSASTSTSSGPVRRSSRPNVDRGDGPSPRPSGRRRPGRHRNAPHRRDEAECRPPVISRDGCVCSRIGRRFATLQEYRRTLIATCARSRSFYARTGRGAEGRARRPAPTRSTTCSLPCCPTIRRHPARRCGTGSPTPRSRSTATARRPRARMHVRRGEGNTPLLPTLGHYQDDLVREDGCGVPAPRHPPDPRRRESQEKELTMPHYAHLVLSIPPASVDEATHDAWYERHVAEILETPGFVAARRYWLDPASPERPRAEPRHLLASTSSRRPMADRRARRSRRRGRARDAGLVRRDPFYGVLRRWRTRSFASPTTATSCSAIRRGFNADQYDGWYYAHARENLTSEGFETVALRADPGDRGSRRAARIEAWRVLRGDRRPAGAAGGAHRHAAGAPRRHPRLDGGGRVRVLGLPRGVAGRQRTGPG